MIGNWFSIAALFAWPLVTTIFYKSMSTVRATVWTILGGFLILPPEVIVKIPMIPGLDKNSIPNICAAIGYFVVARHRSPFRASRLANLLIVVFLVSPLFTSFFNYDPIVVGQRIIPGVGTYDAISASLGQLIYIVPLFLGRRLFRDPQDLRELLVAMVAGEVLYSLPMFIELRMGPQLSNWVYGYTSGSVVSAFRYGGYRPIVFVANGLILAFFVCTCLLAATALWRIKVRINDLPPVAVTSYVGTVLILCKSAGALIYGTIFTPLVAFANPKYQARVALVLAGIGLAYPLLRMSDSFPTNVLVEAARSVNDERAESLDFRFGQENQLLAHASERFLFGWGRYGRSRVYEEDSGTDLSITDSQWIITLGTFGLVGFLSQFGLLALPVFRAAGMMRRVSDESDKVVIATLATIVSLSMIEQLVNASVTPWTWLLVGALLGRTEFMRSVRAKRESPINAGDSIAHPVRPA